MVVAPVGVFVYPIEGEPFEIKKAKIRGVASDGMICAEDEIGLGKSHAGIMVLPNDLKIGIRPLIILELRRIPFWKLDLLQTVAMHILILE
ncbi:MAG: hypothetical protein IPN93_02435 [Bacteroidetes bacterium]|nr:hypothetical protein [Bacteroidota bacterium]